MADTTVPQARPQEPVSLASDSGTTGTARFRLPMPLGLVVLWAAMVAAILLFLLFGTVRVGAGNWIGQRLGITEIWSRFLGYLNIQGATPTVVLLVGAVAGLALVSAAVLLWLALALRDQPARLPDNSRTIR